MRSDLDAMRERHVRREVEQELRTPTGDWGWVRVHQVTIPGNAYDGAIPRSQRLVSAELPRPGTPDGGF
jgi:hypothetical protein